MDANTDINQSDKESAMDAKQSSKAKVISLDAVRKDKLAEWDLLNKILSQDEIQKAK
ncbi:hypothetical protein [Acidithiobacillus ferridurans]|uniref:Uncharacterized protein n=1 Tax=Acidithiobacillus ferridurans TaxID=1232575 RepID=A0A8X8G539_ACIFI|nr:hypothetical protein [Acidithiobacillus ferridurans]MBU2715834.1 hypothetical protein [Acidithiobacillus ferridurans]MBU2722831.1 hypothetical protein [Acidithiobacillus ferridurans]MBU2727782.1 hypothetical protein [Acidithiobacillus ferridurans]